MTDFKDGSLRAIQFSDRLSHAEKRAKDSRWAELQAVALDTQYGDTLSSDYRERVEDNMALLSGDAMVNYRNHVRKQNYIDEQVFREEGIDMPNLELEHFDFVTPTVRGIVGDQQQARLNYVVTDSSCYTQNYIKEQRDKRVTEFLAATVIQPLQQQIFMQYAQENGLTDFFSLGPQERQQAEADIAQRTQAAIPRDIQKFLKFGSRGKLEVAGQAIADALVRGLDLKLLLDEALYFSFATGGLVFTHGIKRLKPYVRIVDMMNWNTWGFDGLFIDNNAGFKSVRMLHPSRVWTEHGEELSILANRKKFDRLNSSGENFEDERTDRRLLAVLDYPGELERFNSINLQTQKGHAEYGALLDRTRASEFQQMDDMRIADLTWQSLRKFKWITRTYPDGIIKKDWHDEDYVFEPNNGDIKEEIDWANEYWHTKILGIGEDAIFLEKGPLPAQYRDPTDPYSSRSNHTGVLYNSLMGHGKFKAPLDYVKSKIHAVNFTMKTIKDREATDVGKVVLMTLAAKPKHWTWGQLFRVMRATKFLPLNTGAHGLTAADVQFFKDIDLGNGYQIAERVNMLNFLIQQIEHGLLYNQARSGNVAASTSVTNNITNLNRSFAQTSYLTVWYNKVAERLIENLIYYGKLTVKGGNVFMRQLLDDASIATIDVDVDEAEDPLYSVHVLIDNTESQQADIAKNIIQPFMQAGGAPFLRHALNLSYSKNRGEINGILDEVEMQAEIANAQAAEQQQMSAQQAMQYEAEIIELKGNIEAGIEQIIGEVKKEVAALGSMTIARGNDINNNLENDYLESAREEREVKREGLEIQRQELSLKDKWEVLKAEVAKNKPKPK